MTVMCKGGIIRAKDVPGYVQLSLIGQGGSKGSGSFDLTAEIRELEIDRIKKALQVCKHNKSRAAGMLNIPRTTLYSKLEEYGLGK